jgi:hypothetical protein
VVPMPHTIGRLLSLRTGAWAGCLIRDGANKVRSRSGMLAATKGCFSVAHVSVISWAITSSTVGCWVSRSSRFTGMCGLGTGASLCGGRTHRDSSIKSILTVAV